MLNGQEIIVAYEALRDLAGQMLRAAQAGDWEKLISLEPEYGRLAHAVQRYGDTAGLDPAVAERLSALVESTLSCNEDIRRLVGGRASELKVALESFGTKRKLGDAYGAVG